MEQLLTVDQAAAWLQVHPKSLYRFIEHGVIPHLRIGRSVRFRPSDLEEWMTKNRDLVTTAS